MSASGFGVVTIVLPDLQATADGPAGIVNDTLGFQLRGSETIRTLSTNNPNNFDVIQGLLYVPDLSLVQNDCSNATLSLIPSNVTTRGDFPPDDYPFIAVVPWTEPLCVQSFLTVLRAEAVRGAIFFQNDTSTNRPPPVSDPMWSLRDGGRWRSENQFPIYAIPGAVGTVLLEQLALYSGNMSSAPFGEQLITVYNPSDSVRLFTRITVQARRGIPSLWVFLIIVLAVLLSIVLTTSIVMHFVQRRRRNVLSRRVARGEVDLEALGIKRLNVPQDLLDQMPQYIFTSKTANVAMSPGKVAPREVPFSQPTCPICLEDFTHGETTVRELPCNHIFHPECIDPFLRDNSSLCPMCKKSALPAGYCPVNVTNLMVRRERLISRMRDRNNGDLGPTSRIPVIGAVHRRIRALSMPQGPDNLGVHSSRVHGHGAYNGTDTEMINVIATNRRSTMPAQPEPAHTSGAVSRSNSETHGANAEEIPAEIAAQGSSARRAWRRERLARQQQELYEEQAQEARAVDVNRPLWRRIGGRFHSRFE